MTHRSRMMTSVRWPRTRDRSCVDVLANDTDVENQSGLEIVSILDQRTTPGIGSPNVSGTVSIDSSGQIQYTPGTNFFGEEIIEYQIRDGRGEGFETSTGDAYRKS